jgi:methionyl-tRNA formyltransferase
MPEKNYIVAAVRPWNSRDQFTPERLAEIQPRYIFFPDWSWKVPHEITSRYECVCFHETDVPFGRGGSPFQNLIARGYSETVITALRMVDQLDAGPVYLKRPLSLLGLAEEIYLRTAESVFAIMRQIAVDEPTPVEQTGEPTVFKRRTPDMSEIDGSKTTLKELFDHIRMLDAQQYPYAFIRVGNYRIEFNRPALRTGKIEADATITLVDAPENEQ